MNVKCKIKSNFKNIFKSNSYSENEDDIGISMCFIIVIHRVPFTIITQDVNSLVIYLTLMLRMDRIKMTD